MATLLTTPTNFILEKEGFRRLYKSEIPPYVSAALIAPWMNGYRAFGGNR